jgi:pre-mRNA 3'-end-processing factor FIP1
MPFLIFDSVLESQFNQPSKTWSFRESCYYNHNVCRQWSVLVILYSSFIHLSPLAPAPSFTTEYNPIQRGGIPSSAPPPPVALASPSQPQLSSTSTPSRSQQPLTQNQNQQQQPTPHEQLRHDEGPDPSTLPAVTAPPSHPEIDPDGIGMFDGRSILEVDLTAMADKPWRRPGSDISDWFNYGFDEISWEAYCYRRRELGDMASVLKANVIVRYYHTLFKSSNFFFI